MTQATVPAMAAAPTTTLSRRTMTVIVSAVGLVVLIVVYKVTRHRIVDDNDLSVLDSPHHEELVLQACHPRFFASQRYLVYARPVSVKQRTG